MISSLDFQYSGTNSVDSIHGYHYTNTSFSNVVTWQKTTDYKGENCFADTISTSWKDGTVPFNSNVTGVCFRFNDEAALKIPTGNFRNFKVGLGVVNVIHVEVFSYPIGCLRHVADGRKRDDQLFKVRQQNKWL
jgi:hypothetical protein